MNVQFYAIDGSKTATRDIPASLLETHVNRGLIHQAVVSQQANRRQSPAHAKTRGEIVGSTKKIYAQKHTGRARRGPIRSPTVRGGGKAFGPRNDRNFRKEMPKAMRHAAIRACITLQASQGSIVGLESFPNAIKTKSVADFLAATPVARGRRVLFVLPGTLRSLHLSARNIPGVRTVDAAYLNPEELMLARSVVVVGDALEKVASVFGNTGEKTERPKKTETVKATKTKKTTKAKKESSPSS
jgi:large subunit ribosomal protein L4